MQSRFQTHPSLELRQKLPRSLRSLILTGKTSLDIIVIGNPDVKEVEIFVHPSSKVIKIQLDERKQLASIIDIIRSSIFTKPNDKKQINDKFLSQKNKLKNTNIKQPW